MANPFDDLIPKGQPQGGAFDDLVPTSKGRDWKGIAGDALAYGATPLAPIIAAARQGLLGPEATAAIQGGRRTERAGFLGVSDSIADAAGMPADLSAAMMRTMLRGGQRAVAATASGSVNPPPDSVGPTQPVGGSQFWRKAFDYAGTLPGRAVDAVNQGSAAPLTDNRTGRITPQDTQERLAYGFGKGAGGAVTSFVPAAMIAQAAPAGSVTQGVAQTLAARPAMQAISGGVGGAVTEETKNPWLGMAAGMAVPVVTDATAGIAKRLLTPNVRLTPDDQAIAAAAQARGIELTPAQATGSRGLQGFEATMRRLPVAGNMAEGQFDRQRQALNRQILAQAGVTADSAGPGVIDQAYRDMGQRYEALIRQQGGVRIDPQFTTDVAAVARDYGRRLDTSVARTFQSYVDDLMPVMQAARTGQNPQVDAQWYQNVRSDLTRAARETTNGPYERAVLALRDALDSAAERTQPQLAPQWQELRRHYANLEMINKAMGSGTQDAIAGNVPLDKFRTAVRGSDAEGFARGRGGDMNELARIAGFLQNRVPNSGTPERLAMTGMLLGRGIGAPLDAAIGLVGPAAIQGAYQSAPVRQFLTTPPQPFMGQTAPTVEALLLQRMADQLRGGALVPQ